MPYIYQITNEVNGKVYIGKTLKSVESRFNEHINEAYRETRERRPLYAAIRKYGPQNFSVKTLEEVDESVLSEREVYWIEALGSFKNGYNATRGGDGRPYVDYDLIFNLYQEGKTIKEIHGLTGHDHTTIGKILDLRNVSHEERHQRQIKSISKPVVMMTLQGKDEKVFSSAAEAAAFLGKNSGSHISAVCLGKRQSAYGHRWRYL